MIKIPENLRDLLEKPVPVSLGTVLSDGQLQVTPVWCDFIDGHIRINSSLGRAKDRAMRVNPNVTVMAIDPENPYRYLEVRGRVVTITTDGAEDHIHKLAKDYMDADRYPFLQPDEKRVMYVIEPLHTTSMS